MRRMLITGGAGFIGCNAAAWFGRDGWAVTVADTLSRRGGSQNLAWLRSHVPVGFERLDVRDAAAVDELLRGESFDAVLHLAAQVAVTTSIADPRADFEVNALGTLNLLESVRAYSPDAIFLYASTNKVYGHLDFASFVPVGQRYVSPQLPHGVGDSAPLDFRSPYGCSKGAADQYVRDYASTFGMRTVSLRQSCIYGPRQFGNEDQGWVAWFTMAALLGKPITIFGDGRQVRDVLYVDDLMDCYQRVIERIDVAAGNAYNVGGGPDHQLSLLELLDELELIVGLPVQRSFADWRTGDQRVYVSDIRHLTSDIGWRPATNPREGVHKLATWMRANLETLASGAAV